MSSTAISIFALLADITISSSWYGHLILDENHNTTLFDQYVPQSEVKQFIRDGTSKDIWKRTGDNDSDSKQYKHLDGAFFETNEDNNDPQRWFITHGKIRNIINEEGRKLAIESNDLSNYNVYLFTGNTHNYGDNDDIPEFYFETEEFPSINNLLQYKVYTQQTFKNELNRQEKDKKYEKIKYQMMSNINRSRDLIGQIRRALEWNFNIAMSKPIIELPEGREDPDYLYEEGIIGYIIKLIFTDNNIHWITIKYFGGTNKWYLWDNVALNDKGIIDGFFKGDTFDSVYQQIQDYYLIEQGLQIEDKYIYECKKMEDGGDDASQTRVFIHGHEEYEYDGYEDGDNNSYYYLLYDQVTSIVTMERIIVLSIIACCIGTIAGWCYARKLYLKESKLKASVSTTSQPFL